MKISFRQLVHAEALARQGNFTLAAAELHISQPALTRSIRSLEEALGLRLFDRLSSGVDPTPAGEVVLARGRNVLRESEDLNRAVADLLGLTSGSLVISTGPYPGDALVPDALAAFMCEAPDIRCRVREADWTDIPDHLLARESDLAVADISGVEDDERFATELLLTWPFFFVCRAGHPLAGRRRVGASDFAHYPLVGNRLPARIEKYLAQQWPGSANVAVQAGPFRVKIDVATFAASRRILLAGDGITLAPLAQVAEELQDGSMTLLRSQVAAPRMHSGLIYLRGRSLSPAAARFVTQLRRKKEEMDRQSAELAIRFGVGSQ
jgi:DNA-binding transcriptional LysR family regulator